MAQDYFSTFFTRLVIDRETTVQAPFTDDLEFIQVTLMRPLPQNPVGVVACLVFGTPAQLTQLNAQRGALKIGVAQTRVILGLNTKGRQGWGTANLDDHWKRGP